MKSYFTTSFKMICILIVVFFCNSMALSESSSNLPPMERWAGKITGMAEGTWILNTWKNENTENELNIKGLVNMSLNSTSGGHGRGSCEGTITGRIKNGVMKADFSGRGRIIEGESDVFGGMDGTFSKNKGTGIYSLITPFGNYTGEWTLDKE